MVFLLAPLLVSTLALAALRTPLPPKFWPTLLLMLLGEARRGALQHTACSP